MHSLINKLTAESLVHQTTKFSDTRRLTLFPYRVFSSAVCSRHGECIVANLPKQDPGQTTFLINYLWIWRHFTFCAVTLMIQVYIYMSCAAKKNKNKFLGWHRTPSPAKRYLKVAILCIIDQILMNNNNNVPENPKFRDNSGTRALPGQRLAFRDCPGHSGTVGTYESERRIHDDTACTVEQPFCLSIVGVVNEFGARVVNIMWSKLGLHVSYPVRVCAAGLCVWSRRFVYVRIYIYIYIYTCMSTKKQAV